MCFILRRHHLVLSPRRMIVDFQHAAQTKAHGMAVARRNRLQAAKVSGVYLATDDKDAVQRRREALENHTRLQREIALLRAKAGREK